MTYKHRAWCEQTCDRCDKKVDGESREVDTREWMRLEIIPHGQHLDESFKRFIPEDDRGRGRRDPLDGTTDKNKENVGMGSARVDLCGPCKEKFLKFLTEKK